MALARLPMDAGVLHERMLSACFRALTNEATPPRYGNHWDAVGFQGTDPATDLRGAGMLALLQLLHFSARRAPLLAAIFAESRKEGTDFPFMVVSINMSQLALVTLRSGSLATHANRLGSVYEAVHGFYEACFLYLYTQWRATRATVHQFGTLKQETQRMATRKPATLLAALERWGQGAAPDKANFVHFS